jgi:hypothetical protein
MKRVQLDRVFISLSFIIISLIVAVGWLKPVLASGPGEAGQVRINNEQVGPFTVLVTTGPQPLTVGQLNVWVRVNNTEKNQILSDAMVMVEATPRKGGSTITAQATHKNAGNEFNYLAHVPLDQSGQWDVTVSIEHELGTVDVSFGETVTGGTNLTWLLGLAVPFVVLAGGVGVYLWRRSATG